MLIEFDSHFVKNYVGSSTWGRKGIISLKTFNLYEFIYSIFLCGTSKFKWSPKIHGVDKSVVGNVPSAL